jgi:hypothetical protein
MTSKFVISLKNLFALNGEGNDDVDERTLFAFVGAGLGNGRHRLTIINEDFYSSISIAEL